MENSRTKTINLDPGNLGLPRPIAGDFVNIKSAFGDPDPFALVGRGASPSTREFIHRRKAASTEAEAAVVRLGRLRCVHVDRNSVKAIIATPAKAPAAMPPMSSLGLKCSSRIPPIAEPTGNATNISRR
jgi:hypothetical protein